MTDQKKCSIFSPMRQVQAAVYGPQLVALWTADKLLVAREPVPMMRIESDQAFKLIPGEKPHLITIPPDKASEVIDALYRGKKIVVRWYGWPSIDENNTTLTLGDFASAYNYTIETCQWPKLQAEPYQLPRDPKIFRANDIVRATFGGERGWAVTFMPSVGVCTIMSPTIDTVYRSRNNQPEQSSEIGEIIVFESPLKQIGIITHKGFTPPPIKEILELAKKAGDHGVIKFGKRPKASLFGFLDAIDFAEKTCKVSITQ